jgi:hypothetical protein
MNANEMADLMIQFDSGRIYEHAEEIANMLREQQNQIAILEQQRDAYKESHEALLAHNLQKGKLES